MPKSVSVLFLAALSSTALLLTLAQQPTTTIKPVPIPVTSPASGEQMYATYCATCHGVTGIGNGPAAPALKSPPADLTLLAQKNHGKFPAAHVVAVLQFGVTVRAHGAPNMPIWGDLLKTLHPTDATDDMAVKQRIANITDYIRSLQR